MNARMKTQLTSAAVLRGACVQATLSLGTKQHERIICSQFTWLYFVNVEEGDKMFKGRVSNGQAGVRTVFFLN